MSFMKSSRPTPGGHQGMRGDVDTENLVVVDTILYKSPIYELPLQFVRETQQLYYHRTENYTKRLKNANCNL